MIGSIYRVLFLGALGLACSWAAFLLLPGLSIKTAASDLAWYSDSFPGASSAPNRPLTLSLPSVLDGVLPGSGDSVRLAGILIARRLAVATNLFPFWIVFLAISLLAGAFLRERLHLGTAYASPTVSFLSKRSGEAALLGFFLWSFAPVPLPYWLFYPALFSSMAATLGYVANLPLRL